MITSKIIETKKRFALCIGNNHYTYLQNLECAITDSQSVAEKLQHLGFDVMVYRDTNLTDLVEALSSLEQKIKEYEAILVFYAGHGFQINGENLLAPIDFNPNSSSALALYSSYRMSDLMKTLGENADKTKIIILDRFNGMLGESLNCKIFDNDRSALNCILQSLDI